METLPSSKHFHFLLGKIKSLIESGSFWRRGQSWLLSLDEAYSQSMPTNYCRVFIFKFLVTKVNIIHRLFSSPNRHGTLPNISIEESPEVADGLQ